MRKQWGLRWVAMVFICFLGIASVCVLAEESLELQASGYYNWSEENVELNYVERVVNSSHHKVRSVYRHVWPEMKFGWKIVVGTIIGFLGAACGSVGGVGGGGIFVPMLALIIGFDPKSSIALSKCMITGTAAATVYYNLKLRHPTLDMPIIDYDLALLFQPMLVLGISIGVSLNVIFADWLITSLLIIILIVTSTKAFLKGIETWKKESLTKKEDALTSLESNGSDGKEVDNKSEPGVPSNVDTVKETKKLKESKVSILENVYWKELGLVVAVWVMILALQIAKNYTKTCSAAYWVLNISQVVVGTIARSIFNPGDDIPGVTFNDYQKIPVVVGVSSYEAVSLYKGRRVIASRGEAGKDWRVSQLVLYCAIGVVAGVLGGMLGLGGGFMLGPLFLELGVPPQVASATATFAMTFSSSMSVVEYYLLKRFPVPYALYFAAVTGIAAVVGQHVVRKLIDILGRASLIIFILAFTIFMSALVLGGVGIEQMVGKFKHHEYLGFDNLCSYKP